MSPQNINITDFNYPLPNERIALHPIQNRDLCKLLYRNSSGVIADQIFADLPNLLPPNAILVYNNTKVINARLHFTKPSGASIEIFCLEPHYPTDYEQNFASTSSCSWLCFVGNSKRWRQGELSAYCKEINTTLFALRKQQIGNAFVIEFRWDNPEISFSSIIEHFGQIPVPPYLNRDSEASDLNDYQTIYSRIEGSVAAPTAGLHFTPELLQTIAQNNIPRLEVTLHVGAGTFQPVKSETVGEHQMHSEFISVDKSVIKNLIESDRLVYAVGTTTVRTLESLYHIGCMIVQNQWSGELPQWYPYQPNHPHLQPKEALTAVLNYLDKNSTDRLVASTRIIIAPPYEYQIVRGLITNFHQPQSTLLLLVAAMIGDDWHQVYKHALDNQYRFLSYGDACLFETGK